MRRFMDEDETPAATTTTRRNRASDARHGFGSPDGMELKDLTVEPPKAKDSKEGNEVHRRDPLVYQNILALADLATPGPILTMSTESETPTPPALTHGGRLTPPDVTDELVKRETASPARGTVTDDSHDVHTPISTYAQSPQSAMFPSPTTSFVSTSSSPHNLSTPTMPSFQPHSYASPMALLHELRSSMDIRTTGQDDMGPIQSGTLRPEIKSVYRGPRISNVAVTPEKDTYVSDMDDSASGSDASIKEPFSDQVKSLNKLLLSTGKRLGKLGETSWTPDQDNDNLTKEEEDLEEVRRRLQQELSMVDFSILKDSPHGTPSIQSTPSHSTHGDRSSPSVNIEWSQLDQSIGGTATPIANPHRIGPRVTPSSINTVWGTESESPAIPASRSSSPQLRPPTVKIGATLKARSTPPTDEVVKKLSSTQPQNYARPKRTLSKVVKADEIPPQNPVSSYPSSSTISRSTSLGIPQPSEASITHPPILVRRSATYPSTDFSARVTGSSSKPSASPSDHHGLTKGSHGSPALEGDNPSSSLLEFLAQYRISSGYISSSIEGSEEENDVISTSASEDTGCSDNAPLVDEEFQEKTSRLSQAKTLTNEGEIALFVNSDSQPAQTSRRIEEEIPIGATGAVSCPSPSETTRREIAPEPPQSEVGYLSETLTLEMRDHKMGSLDAAQSRPGVVENSVFTGELVNTNRGEDDSFSRFAKHTESSGMHSFTAIGSGGERRVETNVTVASVEAGDEETLLVQIRDATRSSAKFSLGSNDGPSDGPVLEAKNLSQIERKKPSFNQLPVAEKESLETSSLACAMTPEMKWRNREDDPIGLLHAIGSHGKNLSPFVHQSTDEDIRVHTKLADWSMDTLVWTQSPSEEGSPFFDPSKISVSNSGNDVEEQPIPSSEDFKHSKKHEPTRRCMFLPFLVVGLLVGAASLIVLFHFGVLGSDNHADSVPSVSPGVAAIAPSVVPFHSDMPSTSFPSTAFSDVPSASPTMSSVSFETVYEIFIRDGLAEDIRRKEYAKDLIESMNRLLNKVLVDLSLDDSRKAPPRLLAAVIPSSEIERFQTTNCPNQDSRNRCEKVFAYITLENAVNSWTEVKVFLDLAVSIGQLQFELDQVNPSSPVAIIDLIEEHEPSPVPSPFPSRSVAPTTFSQIPSMSPSSLTISPNTSSWSPTTDSYLLDLLTENSFDGGEALRTQGSAQNRAYLWLLENSFLDMYSDARLLQRYALATFFYSTHGEDWFLQTNWLSDMDECFWYSRSPQSPCDLVGGLQNLELDYNNINGELPPELGLLSDSLERIVLRGGPNSVTSGTLPSELGYLTRMVNFFIRGNHFAGSLPYQLGRWTALEQFDISGNRFTGTLPPSLFANAVQLSFIDISNNRFTGSLPTQVGNMEKCQRFIIENNMITGAIPTEIGDLRRLQSFYGGSNMLSSLPSEIGRLTFLDTLALQQNTFRGTIPSELSRIQRLLILDLSSNSLSGPIPSQLGNLFAMRDRIDLSFNRLTGTIPSELGKLDGLRGLFLEHNKLSGTVPTEFSSFTRITTIRLGSNDLTGTLPFQVCQVFNETLPAFSGDCSEFEDDGPCMTACCSDNADCQCRYIGTPQEFLCFQQKK